MNVITVVQQYEYDKLDRQTAVTTAVDDVAMARTVTSYDNKGRMTTTAMSDVREKNVNTLSFSYLTNGRIKPIISSAGTFEILFDYTTGIYPSTWT